MTHEDGNKLIAEFMGLTLVRYPSHMKSPFHGQSVWWHGEKTKTFACLEGKEFYHSSWDWLMPVVEKIYDTADVDVREINSEGLLIFELSLCVDIQTVHQAVVQFIQWHNENNEL